VSTGESATHSTKDNPSTLEHSARTAVAAVVSLLVARLFRLPEAYWASVSTLIRDAIHSGRKPADSAQRMAGTAMGTIAGGLSRPPTFPANAAGSRYRSISSLGILAQAFAWSRALTATQRRCCHHHTRCHARNLGWITAVHRFVEVSIGIAVGLASPHAGRNTAARHNLGKITGCPHTA